MGYRFYINGMISMSFIQIILVVIFAALCGASSILDQFEIYRPLVACTVMGIILGHVADGVLLGGSLEMIALGWMNIGAAVSPDPALASIISSILVMTYHQSIGEGMAIAVPLAAAGQVLTIFARSLAVGFMHKADDYGRKGNLLGIDAMNLGAMSLQMLRVVIPVLVVILVNADAVQTMLNAIPLVVSKGLQISGGFIVVVGYAMVIQMMEAKHLIQFFLLGFVIAEFTNFNLVAFGIIGVCIALIYLQLSPKYNNVAASSGGNSGGATLSLEDELDRELDDL